MTSHAQHGGPVPAGGRAARHGRTAIVVAAVVAVAVTIVVAVVTAGGAARAAAKPSRAVAGRPRRHRRSAVCRGCYVTATPPARPATGTDGPRPARPDPRAAAAPLSTPARGRAPPGTGGGTRATAGPLDTGRGRPAARPAVTAGHRSARPASARRR